MLETAFLAFNQLCAPYFAVIGATILITTAIFAVVDAIAVRAGSVCRKP